MLNLRAPENRKSPHHQKMVPACSYNTHTVEVIKNMLPYQQLINAVSSYSQQFEKPSVKLLQRVCVYMSWSTCVDQPLTRHQHCVDFCSCEDINSTECLTRNCTLIVKFRCMLWIRVRLLPLIGRVRVSVWVKHSKNQWKAIQYPHKYNNWNCMLV